MLLGENFVSSVFPQMASWLPLNTYRLIYVLPHLAGSFVKLFYYYLFVLFRLCWSALFTPVGFDAALDFLIVLRLLQSVTLGHMGFLLWHRLSSCSSWALRLMLNSCGGFCRMAYKDLAFTRARIEPISSAIVMRFLYH